MKYAYIINQDNSSIKVIFNFAMQRGPNGFTVNQDARYKLGLAILKKHGFHTESSGVLTSVAQTFSLMKAYDLLMCFQELGQHGFILDMTQADNVLSSIIASQTSYNRHNESHI